MDHNCVAADETGYYEPVLESWPPPEPPPPPAPSPIPCGSHLLFERGGRCLTPQPAQSQPKYVAMGSCTGQQPAWQVGWIRGKPSLESSFLRKTFSKNETRVLYISTAGARGWGWGSTLKFTHHTWGFIRVLKLS